MGGRAILVLLVLAAGLVGVLAVTDREAPTEARVETAALGGRSLGRASRIRWQFHEREPVEIGRAPDGRFQLQEPIVDIASAGYMTAIVNAWNSAQLLAVPFEDDDAGREKAGLAPPKLKLIVEWGDEQRLDIDVGDPGPLGDTRFLRIDGKIWQGGNALLETMKVGLDDLRERQVFRHQFLQTNKLRVDQGNALGGREVVELVRSGKDWLLKAPIEGRADPQAAQKFITAVVSLRVDYFQPSLARRPERDPDIRVAVDGAFGAEELELWVEQGQVWGYLPERGHLFISDNRQYGRVFVNAANNLRARILVPMGESTFEQLAELVVDPGQGRGDRVRLRRAGQDSPWQLLEPVEYPARATPVNEAAYALQRLVARKFVTDTDVARPRASDPRYGMDGARWSLSTRRVHEAALHTLWFGGEADVQGEEALVYCARSDEPDNVALVPEIALETLQRDWTVYCDKTILKQAAQVERLDLRHRDGRARSFRIQEDGSWKLEGEDRDRSEVGDFVEDTLRDFVGKEAVDMREGFGDPDWEFVLMRRNGDALGRVRLWDPGADERLIARGQTRPGGDEQPVGLRLGKRDTTELRALWQ
ncbi:MAG: DUF4340 domain-containing protein [Planctomycetota bacterium]